MIDLTITVVLRTLPFPGRQIHEAVRALNDFMPGYDHMEYQGVIKRVDVDDNGTLSIHEVSRFPFLNHATHIPHKISAQDEFMIIVYALNHVRTKRQQQMTQCLFDIHHGGVVTSTAVAPEEWGTQSFSKPLPPPK